MKIEIKFGLWAGVLFSLLIWFGLFESCHVTHAQAPAAQAQQSAKTPAAPPAPSPTSSQAAKPEDDNQDLLTADEKLRIVMAERTILDIQNRENALQHQFDALENERRTAAVEMNASLTAPADRLGGKVMVDPQTLKTHPVPPPPTPTATTAPNLGPSGTPIAPQGAKPAPRN